MTSRRETPEQRAALDALSAVTRRLIPSEAQTRSLIIERDAAVRLCLELKATKTAIAESGHIARQTVHKHAQRKEGAPE